jgi:hypothetical protein
MNLKDIAEVLETLPRLIQVMNTTQVLSDSDINRCKHASILRYLKANYSRTCLNLDVLNSQLEVIALLDRGCIKFYSITDISINSPVKVCIPTYYRVRDNRPLVPFKSDREYTPTNLDAKVIDFSIDTKEGICRISPLPLILKDSSDNVSYEYSTNDLGVLLLPDIKDIYLLQ